MTTSITFPSYESGIANMMDKYIEENTTEYVEIADVLKTCTVRYENSIWEMGHSELHRLNIPHNHKSTGDKGIYTDLIFSSNLALGLIPIRMDHSVENDLDVFQINHPITDGDTTLMRHIVPAVHGEISIDINPIIKLVHDAVFHESGLTRSQITEKVIQMYPPPNKKNTHVETKDERI